MNKLVSPSQIFCEKCEEMVNNLLKASNSKLTRSDEDELYEKTIDFLHSNLYLLRDMKMISAYSYLVWILVDFRICDNSYEKREEATKALDTIIETVLEHAENEDTLFCTLIRRMQIYFSIAAIYSKLKPAANVIVIEQCYMEAESIIKFADDMPALEKKLALDLWETIKSSHELSNVYSVSKKKPKWNESITNYIKSDPFEGGGLYAPMKNKEIVLESYEPKKRRTRHRKKQLNKVKAPFEVSVEKEKVKVKEIVKELDKIIVAESKEPEEITLIETKENEIKIEERLEEIIADEVIIYDIVPPVEVAEIKEASENESEISFEENDEPPEIPQSEPPELHYEPIFAPTSYITKSTLKNQPMFHPIMLPSDRSKSILPPLKIDPPAHDNNKNDIPVIVRKVIAEFNERDTPQTNHRDSKVNPITNLERSMYILKE